MQLKRCVVCILCEDAKTGGRDTILLGKHFGKIQRIIISNTVGDLMNWQRGLTEQGSGVFDSDIAEVL